MKLLTGPLLFVVVCIIIGSTTLVLAKNGDKHMDESLLKLLVSYFHYLAGTQYDSHRQYAILTVLTEEEAHRNTSVVFHPPIVFPTCNHTLTPANPEEYGNHLAAIPKLRSRPKIHTEEQFLDRLDDLIAAFQRNGSEVAVIVLYTYLAPCEECTQRIVDYFRSSQQVCRNIIVVYTNSTGHNINASYTAKMFHQNGIKLYQINHSDFNFPSSTAERCAAFLDFERFVEHFFLDSESMFDSHDRCDMKSKDEKDEEWWKEEQKSNDYMSIDRYKVTNKKEKEEEWWKTEEWWKKMNAHTSNGNNKMKNEEEEEEEMGDEWGDDEDEEWGDDEDEEWGDDEDEEWGDDEDEEWGKKGKFWSVFKNQTSVGRYL